ncbi:MAG: hypothetical protein QW487_07620 [Candidatus Bathyarchaeia archaeon]|nr:hypothetical protein [Candidatus Bathyarchaeota archaeon]
MKFGIYIPLISESIEAYKNLNDPKVVAIVSHGLTLKEGLMQKLMATSFHL